MKSAFIVLFLGLLVLVTACSAAQQNGSIPTAEKEPVIAPSVQEDGEATPPIQEEVKEFALEANDFAFTPDTITVNKGDRVRLTVTSVDVDHGLAIPEYDINVQINQGQTKSVDFVADKAGTFMFKCSVFCGAGHREMKGTLIVQ